MKRRIKSDIKELIDKILEYEMCFKEASLLYDVVSKGEIPERVPVYPSTGWDLIYMHEHNIKVRSYVESPQLHLEVQLRNLLWRLETFPEEDISGVRLCPNLGCVTAASIFCEVQFPENDLPGFPTPALKNITEVDKLTVPRPEKSKLVQRTLRFYRYISDKLGDRIPTFAEVNAGGAFTDAAMVRGTSAFLQDLITHPKESKKLIEIVTEAYITHNLYLWETAGIEVPEEKCDGDDCVVMLSPEMYEEFAAPYENYRAKCLSKTGRIRNMHLCGDSEHLLPVIKRYLNPREMQISHLTSLSYAKQVMGDCILYGNADPRIVHDGSESDIEIEISRSLREGMPGGKFVFMAGPSAWDQGTPVGNIGYAYQLVRKHGYY